METASIALISLFFSGVSAFTGAVGLGLQFRKQNTFKLLRDGLREIVEFDETPMGGRQQEQLLDEWLAYGALILPAFRQRLLARFTMSLIAIIGAGFAINVDTEGALIPEIPALEWQDLLLMSASLFVGMINNTSLLLRVEEREFMLRLSSLQNIFYEEYVIPAMVEFNAGSQKLCSFPQFQYARARAQSDRDRVSKIVSNSVKKTQLDK